MVEFAGAEGLEVVFSESSKTELNYDYVKFYQDNSHSSYYGVEKYTGGRGGTTSNFPGVGGNPPLYIPSNSFVLHFHSDGSNNVCFLCLSCLSYLALNNSS